MEYFRNDAKSGLFIVVGGLLLIFAIFKVGGVLDSFKARRIVTLNFENSQQVDSGTNVLYRGKKIGRVEDVIFSETSGVDIKCAIDPNTQLFKGTKARIGDKSALGGKIIELFPPAKTAGVEMQPMSDDEVIIGLPPAGLGAAIEALNAIVQENKAKVNEILDNVNLTVKKYEAVGDRIIAFIDKQDPIVTDTIAEAKKALESVKVKVAEVGDNINKSVDDYRDLAKRLNEQVDKLGPKTGETLDEYKALATQLQEDIRATRGQLETVLASANDLMANADALVSDNYEEVTDSILALRETLRNFEVFSAKVAETPSLLVWGGGDGAAPAKLSDEEIFDRELRVSGFIGRLKEVNEKNAKAKK